MKRLAFHCTPIFPKNRNENLVTIEKQLYLLLCDEMWAMTRVEWFECQASILDEFYNRSQPRVRE